MRSRTEDFCPIYRAKGCSDRIFMKENRLSLQANIVCMLGGYPSEMSVGLWRKQSIKYARRPRTGGAIQKEEVCLQPACRLKTHF